MIVVSGYFDRRTHPLVALCDTHGEARWGDPFDDTNDAFNRRLADTSGEWCWAPNVGAPCVECPPERSTR
jgi:hypothetical protein